MRASPSSLGQQPRLAPPLGAQPPEHACRPGSSRQLRCLQQRVAARRLAAATRGREALASELRLQSQRDEPPESRVSIFYHTAWDAPALHGSVAGGEWRDFPFKRVSPAGGNLRVVHINAAAPGGRAGGNGVPLLEFVVHDGSGEYDKAEDGGNYTVSAPGSYRLEGGRLHPVRGEAILLVSDLDDTMVGDDEASALFKRFWERDARLRGSVLVYNTGRALDKWLSLWREKSWCLAAPDILISSVGTKVYQAQPDSFQGWELDRDFAAQLDAGWQLETVREAAYRALAAVGRERMHFRPPDEQNDHKITCGVQAAVLPQVLESIESSLAQERVRAQLVVSGRGEWRFLDIVASRAGKLPALEFVRRRLGFSTAHTIVCGDSGNDRDMLSGSSRAVVVANAEPELKEWLRQQQASDADGRVFIAERDMAAGILQGIKHFGFL